MKCPGTWFAAAAIAGGLSFVVPPADAETIGVFTKSAGNPIARAVRAGADAVAKANGITVFHYIVAREERIRG
jgi:ABC-type sugar transport system substrate-binding protein